MGLQAVVDSQQDDGMLKDFCSAVAEDFALLALLHDKEPTVELLQQIRGSTFPEEGLGLRLESEQGQQAIELLKKAIGYLPERIDGPVLDELSADYASIYLNYAIQVSPEESVWIDEESLTHQDAMFQVRSWYAEHGLEAENWRVRPDDHLVLQLQFISHMLANEASWGCLRRVSQFMDEHLLRWIGAFAERVAARCEVPYFAGIAVLTSAYSEEVRDLLSDMLGEPRPSAEEIEKRMRPKIEQQPVEVKFMPGVGPAV